MQLILLLANFVPAELVLPQTKPGRSNLGMCVRL